MVIKKNLFLLMSFLYTHQSFCTLHLAEQFKQKGYVELCDNTHGTATYDALYLCFDTFIAYLQTHPTVAKKLYVAKKSFIRSKCQKYYSTNFFGFNDESKLTRRHQISFYYSVHFHEYMQTYYPQVMQIPEIAHFFETCREVQQPYGSIFTEAATELAVKNIFDSDYGQPPILLKVVKYLPSYTVTKPHYDGTAFSLFLDSTDNQSLLLSPYKSSFTVEDFISPAREFARLEHQNSIVLIPGILLTEFFIYPTPHIVLQSHKTRYATIAFAMRPNHIQQQHTCAILPIFKP